MVSYFGGKLCYDEWHVENAFHTYGVDVEILVFDGNDELGEYVKRRRVEIRRKMRLDAYCGE